MRRRHFPILAVLILAGLPVSASEQRDPHADLQLGGCALGETSTKPPASASDAVPPDLLRFESVSSLVARDPEATFSTGGFPWLDPDAVLATGAPPSLYYQAAFPPRTILAVKDAPTLRLVSTIDVTVQAIRLSDDDGSRPAAVTPSEVGLWLEEANRIFRRTGIRFLYDPAHDFATLESTLLNSMTGAADPNWVEEALEGNTVAAAYPGRMVLLFRYGPGAQPTGGAFSSWALDFVALTGFEDTTVCGHQNIGLAAHEIGHFFGLGHTFARVFPSNAEAEAFLVAAGNDPACFDGDRLADTHPDPYVSSFTNQCTPLASITLNGIELPLPRENIMSYYEVRHGLSHSQTDLAHWTLDLRLRNAMAGPTNRGAAAPSELDSLDVVSQVGCVSGRQDMLGFSRHKWNDDDQLWVGGSLGALLELRLPVAQPGRYRLDLHATRAPDFALVQVELDGAAAGTPLDLHAPIVLPTGPVALGVHDLAAGDHVLGFRVIGRNPSSTGHGMGLDHLTLEP